MKQISKINMDVAYNHFKEFVTSNTKINNKLKDIDKTIKSFFKTIKVDKNLFLYSIASETLPYLSFEEILNIVKELEKTEFYKKNRFRKKEIISPIYKANRQLKKIKEVFGELYEILTNKENGCGYELFTDLKLRACPYCNLNYIDAVITEDDRNSNKKLIDKNHKILRHHFDHYFPKNKFPFFGISFYNLIPSCYECNSALKGDRTDKTPLNPYFQDFDSMATFYIQPMNINHPMSFYNESDFEIKLNHKDNLAAEHSDLFSLQERYKYRKDYVIELLTKKEIYTDEFKQEIYSKLSNIPNAQCNVNLILWGNYINSEEINLRPLAKLTKDLLES